MKLFLFVLLYAAALSFGLARRGFRSSLGGARSLAEEKPTRLLIVGATGGTGRQRFFQPTHILSEGTRNILRAMKTHGVRRLVCETALGIGDSAWRMGLSYTLIAASRVTWVIVRPGALTDEAKRNRYTHGRQAGSIVRTVRISRADVADFMLNQMTDNTYVSAAPGVCW
jgi:hypothetical protein